MGRLDEAHIDAENVLRKEPENEEANRVYTTIEPVAQRLREAQHHLESQQYQAAVDFLTEVLEHVPWDPALRDMRSEAYLGMGNAVYAISDLRAGTKLRPDDTAGFYKMASLHYRLGEAEEALNEVRECLRLDPDHKECYPLYKRVKKVAKFVSKSEHSDILQKERCF